MIDPEDYEPENDLVDTEPIEDDERWCENEPDDEFLK